MNAIFLAAIKKLVPAVMTTSLLMPSPKCGVYDTLLALILKELCPLKEKIVEQALLPYAEIECTHRLM
jgi:hypothetical protein